MIKKYNQFIKESLLDKIEGYSDEDIKSNFLKGEINVDKYIGMCKENGWELPTYDECRTLFLDGKIDVDRYSRLCSSNDWEQPTEQEIFNSIMNENPEDMLHHSLRLSFIQGVKKAIELGAKPNDHNFEFLNYNTGMGLKDITMKEYEIVKLLLNYGLKPVLNYFEHLVYYCFPENKILIDIIKLLLERLDEIKLIDKLNFSELFEYCEDNKNIELLEILKSYSNVEYKPSKKKWYNRIFNN